MRRVNVTFDDRQRAILRGLSRSTGRSQSELVRRAIDHVYGKGIEAAEKFADAPGGPEEPGAAR